MSSAGDVDPEQRPHIVKVLVVFACLIAAALSGGASLHFAINEGRFPFGTILQFLGSLICMWRVVTYETPVDKKRELGARNE
jgi:hypothetical protein